MRSVWGLALDSGHMTFLFQRKSVADAGYTVDIVYTADMVCTVDMVYTVFTIQADLNCLNSSMYAYSWVNLVVPKN